MAHILKGFVAYSSHVREVVQTLSSLPEQLQKRTKNVELQTWEAADIAGYCLIDPIIEKIQDCDFIIADVTRPNFNVFYEIGFAVGKAKRVFLIRNKAVQYRPELMREVGIFETLGYKEYSNHTNLCPEILQIHSIKPLQLPEEKKNQSQPIFICLPSERAEFLTKLLAGRIS